MRGRRRLTWIEFGIVVVTLAVGAASAGADRTSRRRERRIEENEAAAVATLRLIAEAQEQFKAGAFADTDGNGVGEYGALRELAGAIAIRTVNDGTNTGGSSLDPALLPRSFGRLGRRAELRRSGYLFKVFLPGSAGGAVEEHALAVIDSLQGTVYGDNGSQFWCCYAWPARRGTSGRRTFFLNQSGDLSATNAHRYSGSGRIAEMNAGAAFVAGEGWPNTITGTQALGTVGRDGNFWRVVE